MSKKYLNTVTRFVDGTIKAMNWVAYVFLAMVTLLMVTHIFGRILFNKPILGVIELVQLMMVVVGFSSLSYAALVRAHVRMDLIIKSLSVRSQAILWGLAMVLSCGLAGAVTYKSIMIAINYLKHMEKTTPLLSIPIAPFRCFAAFGVLILCLKLFVDIFRPLLTEKGSEMEDC